MSVCVRCDTEVTSTPEGLCSICLLKDILETPPAIESEGEVLRDFGDYEFLAELGRGGMGVVYRARQISLRRQVAVKLILPGPAANRAALERFRRETEAVARLDHPGIVPVYEVGEYGGQPYFSMKLVEGGRSLAGWTGDSERAARIMVEVSQAVHYAHQRGILHRDLKPSNILIDHHERPFLMDFGLAKLLEEPGQDLTRSTDVVGTLHYMPPEQASGRSAEATVGADVYGLGAIFYELLTGQPPFVGDGVELIRRVIDDEPTRISLHQPDVDQDLETICLKCLEKEEEGRYASAADVAEELERWLKGEPIVARPVGVFSKCRKWARRRPAYAALLGLALLLLVIVAGGSSVFSWKLNEEAKLRTAELVRSLEREADYGEDEDDAFMALHRLTEALRLHEHRLGSETSGLRIRIGALLRNSPKLERMWFHEGSIESLRLSPGQKDLAICGSEGKVWVRNVATGEMRCGPLEHGAAVRDAVFDGTGRFLATVCGKARESNGSALAPGFARVWDLEGGRALTPELPLHVNRHKSPRRPPMAFASDASRLVTCHPDGATLWTLSEKEPRAIELVQETYAYCAVFSPDDRWVVTGSKGEGARLWDATTGALRHIFVPQSHVMGAAFQHDGARLALLANHGREIVVFNLDDTGAGVGEPAHLRDRFGAWIVHCVFEPHGSRLVATSFSGLVTVWDTATGTAVAPAIEHARVFMADFSQDGRRVVSTSLDGSVRVWDVSSGKPRSPSLMHRESSFSAVFGAGDTVFSSSQDGVVRQWTLASERAPDADVLLAMSPKSENLTFCVRSSDGSHLLAGANGDDVTLWKTDSWTLRRPVLGLGTRVRDGAFSPDGAHFAVVEGGPASPMPTSRVHLRNVESGDSRMAPIEVEGIARRVRFSPKGDYLSVCGGTPEGGFVGVWDRDGRAILPRIGHPNIVGDVAIAAEGDLLATVCEDRHIRVFALPSGRMVGESGRLTGQPRSVCWSPQGGALLTNCSALFDYGREAARLWNPRTGFRRDLYHHDGVLSAIFDRQGRRIATGGQDMYVRFWDAETGAPAAVPPVRMDDTLPQVLTFSPDGRLLAAGGRFGRGYVWDTATGQRIAPIQAPAEIKHLSFSADNREIVVGCSDPPSLTIHDLREVTMPVADLQRLMQVLTGFRLDPEGGLSPLDLEELRSVWRTFSEE